MKASELIKELQKLDGELDVVCKDFIIQSVKEVDEHCQICNKQHHHIELSTSKIS